MVSNAVSGNEDSERDQWVTCGQPFSSPLGTGLRALLIHLLFAESTYPHLHS